MNKGIGYFIIGILAVVGCAAFAALFIKNKLKRERELDDYDFDDFGDVVDDDELDHFFTEDEEGEAIDGYSETYEDEFENADDIDGLSEDDLESQL